MLLQMVILMTIASTVVEGFIAWYLPGWRALTKKFRLLDILFSFFLSYILGKMFGAQGVVIAISGVASTMTSMPMYPAMDWYEKNQSEVKVAYSKVRQTTIDCAILFYKLCRLITIPIRMGRWCHQQWCVVREAARPSVTP